MELQSQFKNWSTTIKNWHIILLLALLSIVGFRGLLVINKNALLEDGVTTWIVSSGRADEYRSTIDEGIPPYNAWAPASEWKLYLQPTPEFSFGQIAHDLLTSDIHPPLYFWMVHIVLKTFGSTMYAAPGLNVFLALVTGVILFFVLKLLLDSSECAAFGVLIWALSAGVSNVSLEGRQYDLLAMSSAFYMLAILLFERTSAECKPLVIRTLILFTALLIGFLTHYIFLVLVFPLGMMYLGLLRKNWQPRLLIGAAIAVILSLLIVVWLFPGYFSAFTRADNIASSGVKAFAMNRIIYIVRLPLQVLAGIYVPMFLKVIFLGLLTVIIGSQGWRFIKDKKMTLMDLVATQQFRAIICFGVGYHILYALLYLSAKIPFHAYFPKYLTPCLLIFPILPLLTEKKLADIKERYLLIGLIVGMAFTSCWNIYANAKNNSRENVTFQRIENADRIVTDSLRGSFFFSLMCNLPDDKQVFVASNENLASDTSWIESIEPGDVYYHVDRGGGDTELIVKVLKDSGFTASKPKDGLWGFGNAWEIQPDTDVVHNN